MNETLQVMARRYSCRDYTERLPDEKTLMAIAQAGLQAPSGMNRQLWQIIVVKNPALMADLEAEGMENMQKMGGPMAERILARGGKLFYGAPCMMLLAIKEAYPKGAELIDLGILAENIVLAATSLGVDNLHCGFVGLAFAGDRAAEFKARLQFPEGYECGMGVLLGYGKAPGEPHQPDPGKITVID